MIRVNIRRRSRSPHLVSALRTHRIFHPRPARTKRYGRGQVLARNKQRKPRWRGVYRDPWTLRLCRGRNRRFDRLHNGQRWELIRDLAIADLLFGVSCGRTSFWAWPDHWDSDGDTPLIPRYSRDAALVRTYLVSQGWSISFKHFHSQVKAKLSRGSTRVRSVWCPNEHVAVCEVALNIPLEPRCQ